jgi:hypothetical protein
VLFSSTATKSEVDFLGLNFDLDILILNGLIKKNGKAHAILKFKVLK